ncbi:MAG: hypothetical protein ACLFVJ_15530 [Persicimonas sp.]
MNQPRPIKWKRRDRLRIRALTGADLEALSWIDQRPPSALCTLETPVGPAERRRLLDAQPALQLALERGHQLIGAALAAPTLAKAPFAAHPWTALGGMPQTPQPSAEGAQQAHLRGMGLLWRDVLDEQAIAEAVTLCRRALVQQFGYESVYSVVEAIGYAGWRETLTPAAYVQQVHAGAVDDPVVSGWLEQGFALWGWMVVEGALQVVVRWQNRAR